MVESRSVDSPMAERASTKAQKPRVVSSRESAWVAVTQDGQRVLRRRGDLGGRYPFVRGLHAHVDRDVPIDDSSSSTRS